jgi:ABC-type lipoprotein export system ATPase subunit
MSVTPSIAEKPLFTIDNLSCSYNGVDKVLEIQHISIPRGKLIFILGASGSGKSTILETLGLMNKTFTNGSSIVFDTGKNKSAYKWDEIWDYKSSRTIEKIRNDHFSFIFQDTNLMQNFSAYENVCLSQMLQGTGWKDALEKASNRMIEIKLQDVNLTDKASELSGGQKQRLSFVRAITPQYTVLFGDEPTGNLDEKTSEELMQILKEDVKSKNATAIIVSHNIKQSISVADMIIIITKQNGIGEIKDDNIFYGFVTPDEKVWKNQIGIQITNIEKKIMQLL